MKEAFIAKNFAPASLTMINRANAILDEYERQGYRLTLRQLYYQLVARDIIPNNLRSYKNLGNLVNNARQAGLIDWGRLEDRNRETVIPSHWDSPAEILRSAAHSFRIDKWRDQSYHIEVMVEKDALSGVLEPVCRRLDVGLTANKGYSSASTMYEIGKRIEQMSDAGKQIRVLYLGDHDPSGIDMTRDVRERLGLFSWLGDEVEVIRLALNWDQVLRWQPPENPVKDTDSRAEAYHNQFGESCWELDAVEPAQLAQLVTDAVLEVRDEDLWDEAAEREHEWRQELLSLADRYDTDGSI